MTHLEPGHTYEIRTDVGLPPDQFDRFIRTVKNAGGWFNPGSKTWTVRPKLRGSPILLLERAINSVGCTVTDLGGRMPENAVEVELPLDWPTLAKAATNGIISEHWGPANHVRNESDWRTEQARERWYKVDAAGMDALIEALAMSKDGSRMAEQEESDA